MGQIRRADIKAMRDKCVELANQNGERQRTFAIQFVKTESHASALESASCEAAYYAYRGAATLAEAVLTGTLDELLNPPADSDESTGEAPDDAVETADASEAADG